MSSEIFSIIIPAYNAEQTIIRCLSSLISNIDYIKDVIVVDDCSTDETAAVVKGCMNLCSKLHLYSTQENSGPGVARRIGLIMAKGEWVTFLDADDCLTASSLSYVADHLYDNLVLLHSQTIYYESGSFNKNHVDFSDYSCGGNFYRRSYLTRYNLLPHEELRLCEDEYFNAIVIDNIKYLTPEKEIAYYEYPVYEVHHDVYDGLSYALKNWQDYLIKYHLLSKQYVCDFFSDKDTMQEMLKKEYIDNYIFCFFLYQCLIFDRDINVDNGAVFQQFSDALQYYCEQFNGTKSDFIEFYNNNPDEIQDMKEGASLSTGIEYREFLMFDVFLKSL